MSCTLIFSILFYFSKKNSNPLNWFHDSSVGLGFIVWKTLPYRIEKKIVYLKYYQLFWSSLDIWKVLLLQFNISVFLKKSCFLESSLLHNYQMLFHFCFPVKIWMIRRCYAKNHLRYRAHTGNFNIDWDTSVMCVPLH